MFFASSYDNARDGRRFWPYAFLVLIVGSAGFWLIGVLVVWACRTLIPAPQMGHIGIGAILVVTTALALPYIVSGRGVYRWLQTMGFSHKHGLPAVVGFLLVCTGEWLVAFALDTDTTLFFPLVFFGGGLWLFLRHFSEGPDQKRHTARQFSRRN